MPHCILEYPANIPDQIDFKRLFVELHRNLIKTGEFKLADMKSRAISYEHYLTGDGKADRLFVNLEIRILEGRPEESKSQLSSIAMDILVKYFTATLRQSESSITVHISDLNQASYKKRLGRSP